MTESGYDGRRIGMNRENAIQHIYDTLDGIPRDLSIPELADEADVSQKTARKYIRELIDRGRVENTRKVGICELYDTNE